MSSFVLNRAFALLLTIGLSVSYVQTASGQSETLLIKNRIFGEFSIDIEATKKAIKKHNSEEFDQDVIESMVKDMAALKLKITKENDFHVRMDDDFEMKGTWDDMEVDEENQTITMKITPPEDEFGDVEELEVKLEDGKLVIFSENSPPIVIKRLDKAAKKDSGKERKKKSGGANGKKGKTDQSAKRSDSNTKDKKVGSDDQLELNAVYGTWKADVEKSIAALSDEQRSDKELVNRVTKLANRTSIEFVEFEEFKLTRGKEALRGDFEIEKSSSKTSRNQTAYCLKANIGSMSGKLTIEFVDENNLKILPGFGIKEPALMFVRVGERKNGNARRITGYEDLIGTWNLEYDATIEYLLKSGDYDDEAEVEDELPVSDGFSLTFDKDHELTVVNPEVIDTSAITMTIEVGKKKLDGDSVLLSLNIFIDDEVSPDQVMNVQDIGSQKILISIEGPSPPMVFSREK